MGHMLSIIGADLRASPAVLSMWPCKIISHTQGLVICFVQPHT
jgi:hypothetical protein